ncbi:hypothetical protein CHS0354_023127 [Potamilus streckersoni]|uniref:TIR domain-containing protein n=1 Tax=Potamilus streckersoni TaxID=2493646 RepID=A0AAE0RND0_9BIVA|nr:hypothetical protein CHS0354_023127 [Potamilus streckersoni]
MYRVSCDTSTQNPGSHYAPFPTILPNNTRVFFFRSTKENNVFKDSDVSFTDISWGQVEEITLRNVENIQLNETRLAGLSRLRVLRLQDDTLRNISHPGAFRLTPNLEVLDLSYNPWLPLKCIVAALNESLPNLKYLDLCNLQNSLSEPFILNAKFAKAIENKPLITLNVSKTKISLFQDGLTSVSIRIRRKVKRRREDERVLMERFNDNDNYDQQRYFVFLSYAGRDDELVSNYIYPVLEQILREKFGNNGNLICTGDTHFTPGRWVAEEIDRYLNRCHVIVMVVSKHFIESEWCKYEVMLAKQKNKLKILLVNEEVYREKIPSALNYILKLCTRATWRLQNGQFVIRPEWNKICEGILKASIKSVDEFEDEAQL